MSYPLVGRFLDVPRFITFSLAGLAVGWWGFRRRRVEAALRESEERYALAMEAAGDGHTDWNLETGEHYISPGLLKICGYAPGTTFRDRAEWVRRFPFHPEDRPKWEAAMAAHFAGRESHFKMELRIMVRGEVRWTEFHFLSTRDAAGTPIRWTGSIADITEQKRVEEALRASEERYSLAMEASEEGYVDADIDTDQFITSERMNEIFGIPRGTRFADRSDFLKHFRFYGDDGKTYGDMIRAVGTQGGPDRYEFEFRIVLPSGEVRWLWTRGKVDARRRGPGAPAHWRGGRHNRAQARRGGAARVRGPLRARGRRFLRRRMGHRLRRSQRFFLPAHARTVRIASRAGGGATGRVVRSFAAPSRGQAEAVRRGGGALVGKGAGVRGRVPPAPARRRLPLAPRPRCVCARCRRQAAAHGRLDQRRRRPPARRGGAARIRAALRARHGCERVGYWDWHIPPPTGYYASPQSVLEIWAGLHLERRGSTGRRSERAFNMHAGGLARW